MNYRKIINYSLLVCLLAAVIILAGGNGLAGAIPASETDETKVPHYFGPYPNYANSPFTRTDAIVTIDPPLPVGSGRQATATATVGVDGAITAIKVVDPGSGYSAVPGVTINNTAGTNSSATATADAPSMTGSVTSISMTAFGGGYTLPVVTITDSSVPPGFGATATAYGSVDAVSLQPDPDVAYAGFEMPTVEFELPDDPNGVQATGHVVCTGDPVDGPYCQATAPATTVDPESVVVDNPGSGYAIAPNVYLLDGTRPQPIRPGGMGLIATATLEINDVKMDTFGSGYTQATTLVSIDEYNPADAGTGATASVTVETGAITGITVVNAGSGYVTPGGMRKFIDPLPGLCDPAGVSAPMCPTDGSKYIPLAVPDTNTWTDADTYEIALVQFRMSYSSDLKDPISGDPVGTLTRGYVQIDTGGVPGSQEIPIMNELLNGDLVNTGYVGVTPPQYLGPIIAATKDRPVRIVFRNLLPTGTDGNLFLPVDTTVMGSGPGPVTQPVMTDDGTVMDGARNPLCGEDTAGKPATCFSDNRATLHLHGGITPWISDGTPHQWITPAGENTQWPEGVSVENVPDMNVCEADDDGCSTFYYTNQQSARFMFYHDHAWGITRLNVYAGEAAGYLISDPTEQKLIADGTIPSDQIPLVIQDKTFVPDADQLAAQDPTWDTSRWGGYGSMWAPHVYMPAQNPGDPSGMSPFGRWMYGPWFWPPADPAHGPIDNPYYDPNCDLNDDTTWQYQEYPYCEPALMPGTPNISVGMEAFNDTPIVNGTAYPTVTLEPKSYRLRILNAANDRFFNLQWYVGDPNTASTDMNNLLVPEVIGPTEVALNPAELAAAQTDPVVFPTPDTTVSPPGPDWIQIGTEGGFLPAPVIVPNQPTTWIMDPTVFNVGNVDQHSLLVAPAERADVIVDFSQFAGQTLILYNDAPAAFPARVPGYDYYTGGPDLYPVGAPTTLPGYGPNTRTVMQVKIAGSAAPAFNMTKLNNAFTHKLDGSGVFEEGQNPIVVGQAAYNSAYGTNFVANGWCNTPGSTSTSCDGFARIAEQGGFQFGFNTLDPAWAPGVGKMQIPLQPKGIHDEMNATNFDEYGRMEANIGLEAPGATPLLQNIILYPYVNPQSEIFDGTNLPVYNTDPDIEVEPISSAADGTQIWKITHNGVDTHPIHWHLYDLQLLNRVTWDNIVQPPEPTELGWKDTIRISPLEDTIVAIRPIIPKFDVDGGFTEELPNSVRPLDPMMPLGSTTGFNNTDAFGNPTDPIINEMVNFGWEYVFHCHILSHEEMDMMRPVSVAMPPRAPSDLAGTIEGHGRNTSVVLTWLDNSITETSFTVKRALSAGGPWTVVGTVGADVQTFTDPIGNIRQAYWYQVFANNEVGYGGSYSVMTVNSSTDAIRVGDAANAIPADPTNLTAVAQAGPQVLLSWTDNATDETGFLIERAPGFNPADGDFAMLVTLGPGNGQMSYTDTTVVADGIYTYRVFAVNSFGPSSPSNEAFVSLGAVPAAPGPVLATAENRNNKWSLVSLTWTDVDNETGYTIQRATNSTFTANVVNVDVGANVTDFTTGNLPRNTPYYFRVLASNGAGPSPWANASPFPIVTP